MYMFNCSILKQIFFTLIFIGLLSLLNGQDIVFSQFEQVASYYNPAYASFERDIGAGISVRNQWANTNGSYFHSYVFSDVYLKEYKSGVGLDLSYSDANSGGSSLLTIGGRYNYRLNLNRKWSSSIGLSASYASIKMNKDKLVFEDQLNSKGGLTSTSENADAVQNRGYLDLGIGSVFYIEGTTEISFGIKHINFPSLKSLNNNKTLIKPMLSIYAKHRMKVAGSFYRPNSKEVYMLPSLLFLNQNQFNQIKIGSAVEVELVQFGFYYRSGLGKLDGEYSKNDALVVMGGLNTESFNMTYSYDMNVSAERSSTSSHEISLIYIKKPNILKGLPKAKKRR